jgi:RNA polymerase sigma-70 factor (ECF subfamily)
MSDQTTDEAFEAHRPALLALAYRMLGDMARAEDMLQEAWLRWQRRRAEVEAPKAYLVTMVTRLCLDDLTSPRARHEESRGDRLPEPIDLKESGLDRLELLDQISMAFLVVLQRLTPAERAVLVLHEVFDMSHDEIAALLGKTAAASRQLLTRARQSVTAERRVLHTTPEEHRRLLMAFVGALSGEERPLLELLADDVVLIGDAGPEGGRFGKVRNVGRPVTGQKRVAAFIKALAQQEVSPPAEFHERTLNGQPAVVAVQNGRPVLAILLAVADGKIRHIFMHADPDRLTRIGALN